MPKPSQVSATESITDMLFEKFQEHRKGIVGGGILLVVIGIGILLYVVMRTSRIEGQWYSVTKDAVFQSAGSDMPLKDAARHGVSDVKKNSLLLLASRDYSVGSYQAASDWMTKFHAAYSGSFLANQPSPDPRYNLAEAIAHRIDAELRWQKANAFQNLEPDTHQVALVETSKGAFWLGFFPKLAPEHVKNFIERAKAGDFNGTKVYRITPGAIYLGGATTRDSNPRNDTELEKKGLLQPEKGRFALEETLGRVSSVAGPDGESPSRITIVVSDIGSRNLNKTQTVFAQVVVKKDGEFEPLSSVQKTPLEAIENVVTYGKSGEKKYRGADYADLSDHPIEPVTVERVSIWSGGKIESGHAWDTSKVKPPVEKEASTVTPTKKPGATNPPKKKTK